MSLTFCLFTLAFIVAPHRRYYFTHKPNVFFIFIAQFLRDTKLPVETLRAIWDLSDIDRDGYLDRFEFILVPNWVY